MGTDRQALFSARRLHFPARRLLWVVVLLVTALLLPVVLAQQRARSGKTVVDTYCAACHQDGRDGAPRIGDARAWAPRAAQGLSALTEHALQGIRNMPAHGGSPGLNAIEIERAVTYMVNRSGGRWIEPLGGATPAVLRTGEQLVQAQCSLCHRVGQQGAPKIGDRKAWAPRLAKGLDAVVRVAVHGHGAMPARGGLADATDAEIQGAVVYMFNFGLPPAPAPVNAPAAAADPYHKVVDGTEVYLGILRAQAAAGLQPGTAPRGKGYYHLNLSLFDSQSKASIPDARVMLRVSDAMTSESRRLQPLAANGAVSYGGYFRLLGPTPYTITAQIERPGVAGAREVKFEYKVW